MPRPIHRVVPVLVICVAVGAPFGVATQPTSSPQNEPATGAEVLRVVSRVDTIDELKPNTAEEQARARAFNFLGGSRLVAGTDLSLIVDRGMYTTPRDETPTYWHVVDTLACSAPVIVVARPTPRRVRMNEIGTFLFTEHVLSVSRWIVQNAPVPESGLEFLKPGGEVAVGEDRIVTSTGYPLFRKTDYLFFLRPVPNSTAFVGAQVPIPSRPPWDVVLPFLSLPLELKANLVTFEAFAADLDTAARECRARK